MPIYARIRFLFWGVACIGHLILLHLISLNVQAQIYNPSTIRTIPVNGWNEPTILVRNFNQEDGLPVEGLSDIVFDSRGKLCITTYDGFTFFNGTQFHTFSEYSSQAIGNNRLLSIASLKDSSLIVSTEEGRFYLVQDTNSTLLTIHDSLATTKLALGSRKINLLAYTKNTIFRYSGGGTFADTLITIPRKIVSLFQQNDTLLWIQHKRGLFRYSITNKELTEVRDTLISQTRDLASYTFHKIKESSIVVGGLQKATLYENSGKRSAFTTFSDPYEYVYSAFDYDSTTILLATTHNHYLWNYISGERIPLAKPFTIRAADVSRVGKWKGRPLIVGQNTILWGKDTLYSSTTQAARRLIVDSLGQLWLATSGDGLYCFSYSPFNILGKKQGFPANNIYGMYQYDTNDYFFASFDNGLIRLKSDTLYQLPYVSELSRVIYPTRRFGLLAGYWSANVHPLIQPFTQKGTVKTFYNLPEFFSSFHNAVNALYEDSLGNFWVGSKDGLLFLEKDSTSFIEKTSSNGSSLIGVRMFYPQTFSETLIATEGQGLWILNDTDIHPHPSLILDSAPKYIRDILSWYNGWLLISEDQGISYMVQDSSSQFSIYNLLKGSLPIQSFHRVLEDDNSYLWFSSNNGLFRIHSEDLYLHFTQSYPSFPYQHFSTKHGLPHNEFNGGVQNAGIIDQKGQFWWPTQRGIVQIDPTDFLETHPFEQSELYLYKVSTNQRDIFLPSNSHLVLNKEERRISLTVEVSHFGVAKPTLQYTLNNDDRWINLPSGGEITLASLQSGEQNVHFRIKELGASHPVFTLSFSVSPYFYETQPFFFLLFSFFTGIFFSILIMVKKNAKKREALLNRKVKERTSELSHQTKKTEAALELIKEQALQLKANSEYRQNMLIGLTHEFRTPLSLITGPVQILIEALKDGDKDKVNRQIDVISKNSKRLKSLVDKILLMLKYSNDKQSIIKTPQYLHATISSIVSTYNSISVTQNVQFQTDLKSENCVVEIDQIAMELVLGNLLSNAFKFSSIRGENAQVFLKCYSSDQRVTLEISDNGPGIPQEDIPLIFDPFYRSGQNESMEGSGVGLAVAKKLVSAMNGSISVSSIPFKYTSFSIHLPKSKKSPAPVDYNPNQTEALDDSIHINKSRFAHKVILFVDDNDDLRDLMGDSLGSIATYHSLSSGKEALEYLRHHPIDLLISDVMMPEMNGFEFVELVRSSINKNLPVIFLSGGDDISHVEQSLSLGAEAYLTKPVTMANIRALIYSVFIREEKLQQLSNLKKNESELKKKITSLILSHLADSNLSVNSLATTLAMSRSSLYRKWNETEDISLNEYIIQTRLKEVIFLLKTEQLSLSEAALSCGFSDLSYFSRAFKKRYGTTPSKYLDNLRES